MSALTGKRIGKAFAFRYIELTVPSGTGKVYHNGRACFNGTGKVVPATSTPGLAPIGKFFTNPADFVDATSADKVVTIDLERELYGEWWANATSTDAIAATDIGKMAYLMDDQTVCITPTTGAGVGRSPAGRIWGFDSVKGILVQAGSVAAKGTLSQQSLPAFAANDSAPTSLEHDAVYLVPAYTANSTVTLPAAAPDGTRVHFVNDGSSAFTLTYRDATGPVNLNTATTASKRHGATAVKQNGKWYLAGLTVAP